MLAGLCYHGVAASPCSIINHCFASLNFVHVGSLPSASRSPLYTCFAFVVNMTRRVSCWRRNILLGGVPGRLVYLCVVPAVSPWSCSGKRTCIVYANCFPKSELSTSVFLWLKDMRDYSFFFFFITIASHWELNGHNWSAHHRRIYLVIVLINSVSMGWSRSTRPSSDLLKWSLFL